MHETPYWLKIDIVQYSWGNEKMGRLVFLIQKIEFLYSMTGTDSLFTMRPLYSRDYTKAFVRILNDLYFANVMYVKGAKCNASHIILIY